MIFKGIRNKKALTVLAFLVFLLTVFTIPSIANASNPPGACELGEHPGLHAHQIQGCGGTRIGAYGGVFSHE